MGGMQGAMATLANGLVECGVSVDMYAIFRLEHFYPLNPAIQFSESPHAPNEYNIISRIVSIVRNIRKAAIDSKAETVVVYGKFYSALTLLATLGLKKTCVHIGSSKPSLPGFLVCGNAYESYLYVYQTDWYNCSDLHIRSISTQTVRAKSTDRSDPKCYSSNQKI